ncbi:ribonuclease H-like domain-containing protein [Tanacetum coccineum]
MNSNTVKQTFNANTDIKMNDKPSTSSLSSGFASEQMQKLLSMINDKSFGSIHANMAGRASFFNGNVSFNIKFSENFYANSSLSMTTITMGWIINSRANQYLIVSIAKMYNIMDIFELKIIIGHPNGTLATINHVGNLKLTNNVILYDILVVPGYCVSLLSVNKLIRDSKMFVGFDENKCYIQELKREKVLGTGSESGGLYLFDMNNSYCIGNSNVILSLHVSKLLWHNRLGHPADQVLFVLKKDLSISKNTFVPMCEVCQRAKQTREPFPLSDHKSKTLGELFHLDLWGPYRVHNREGYRYLLTVVDDYSRAVWVYLVKTKDETTCAHTPQQNGIGERKHRYLLNVARSLMFQGGIPLRFWSNCVLTVVHLINKLPSSVLNGKSLFELIPESPSDDGKDSSVEDGSLPHSDSLDSAQGRYLSGRHSATQTPLLRRSDRQSKFPVRLNDYVLNLNVKYGIEKYVNYSKLNNVNLCFATTLNKSVEPIYLSEAMFDPNWIKAMNNEIEALNRNNTWTISDLPIGRKPIGSKWIWKIKYKASGEIERYKGRLVAKGFSQREWFDYDETFSHMVNMVIARCLIGLAIVNNWPLYQLDVNNAFLYGDLIKDVYMTLSDGYNNEDKSKVYKLNKSLCGLKQASRQWKAKLTTTLAEHGFE